MKCSKPVRRAQNGNSRGTCRREANHTGYCTSPTCFVCGASLTVQNATPYRVRRGKGQCNDCLSEWYRDKTGAEPRVSQVPGKPYSFPCGCTDVLPKFGESNLFVHRHSEARHSCRISKILLSSLESAKKGGFKPINPKTPHSVIRRLMQEPNCVLCGRPLKWKFVKGYRNPHLHHDHITGELHGFAHPNCNVVTNSSVVALQRRVRELEAEVKQCKESTALPKAA